MCVVVFCTYVSVSFFTLASLYYNKVNQNILCHPDLCTFFEDIKCVDPGWLLLLAVIKRIAVKLQLTAEQKLCYSICILLQKNY